MISELVYNGFVYKFKHPFNILYSGGKIKYLGFSIESGPDNLLNKVAADFSSRIKNEHIESFDYDYYTNKYYVLSVGTYLKLQTPVVTFKVKKSDILNIPKVSKGDWLELDMSTEHNCFSDDFENRYVYVRHI